MLKRIVEGHEPAPLVVIEDTVEQSGVALLKTFVAALASRCEAVHWITYEFTPEVTDGFTSKAAARIHHHNAGTDPLGWNAEADGSTPVITMETDLPSHLTQSRPMRTQGSSVAVVIDSVSNVILHRSAAYTCRVLHKLRSWKLSQADEDNTQVVALVHGDLHDEVTLAMIHHTADAVLRVVPSGVSSQPVCNVLHKRSSGKVSRMDEYFTIGAHFESLETETVGSSSGNMVVELPEKAPDPAANLTFNLTLSDKEKEARRQLVLPYMQQQQQPSSETSGKIYYQLDEADDFDEEDPDDDLDI